MAVCHIWNFLLRTENVTKPGGNLKGCGEGCDLQAPNLWTPQLLSMTLMAYARNDCVHSLACQALLRALVEEALQQIEETDCQVRIFRTSDCLEKFCWASQQRS